MSEDTHRIDPTLLIAKALAEAAGFSPSSAVSYMEDAANVVAELGLTVEVGKVIWMDEPTGAEIGRWVGPWGSAHVPAPSVSAGPSL